jgi:aryl-alcohol dehydrogenase-like predicted oxidoreductase
MDSWMRKNHSIFLNKFTEGGFNFIDTADTYSWWVNGKGGQSEEIIGKWMKERKIVRILCSQQK